MVRDARSRPAGVVAGALVALLVLAVGLGLAFTRNQRWTATAALLVQPHAASGNGDTLASLYDTLSSGQVAATYAELFKEPALKAAAEGDAGVPAGDRGDVAVDVTVVPDTSILDVTVGADDAGAAERVADALAKRATDQVAAMTTPYGVTPTAPAAGTAERAGPDTRTVLAVVVLVALVAGLLVQQGWASVVRSRRWGRALAAPASEWPPVVTREQTPTR